MPGHCDPPKEHQFKKGQSGNPGGLRKGSIAKKVLKQYTQSAVSETFNELIGLSTEELKSIVKEHDKPVIRLIVANSLLRDLKDGELSNMERVLERIIGKVPLKQELGGVEGVPLVPPQVIINRVIYEHKENNPTG